MKCEERAVNHEYYVLFNTREGAFYRRSQVPVSMVIKRDRSSEFSV